MIDDFYAEIDRLERTRAQLLDDAVHNCIAGVIPLSALSLDVIIGGELGETYVTCHGRRIYRAWIAQDGYVFTPRGEWLREKFYG